MSNDDLQMPEWVKEAAARQNAEDAKQKDPLFLCQETLARHRRAMAAMSGINTSWKTYKELSDADVAAAMEMLARIAITDDENEQRFIVNELERLAGYIA